MSDEQPQQGVPGDDPTRVMPQAEPLTPSAQVSSQGPDRTGQPDLQGAAPAAGGGGVPGWAWAVIGLLVVLVALVAFALGRQNSVDTTTTTTTTSSTTTTIERQSTTLRPTTSTRPPTTERPTTTAAPTTTRPSTTTAPTTAAPSTTAP